MSDLASSSEPSPFRGRREDHQALTLGGLYVGDLDEGAVAAVFVRSPEPHAILGSIDVAAAATAEGVLAVHTAHTLALGPVAPRLPTPPGFEHWPLATDRVRYVGEPVALAVADTLAHAEDAVQLVEVEYERLRVSMDPEAALRDGSATLFAHGDSVVTRYGDVPDLHSDDEVSVSARVTNHRIAVVPMEGHAVLARPEDDGGLTVWLATQGAHPSRDGLAKSLGLDAEAVRVIAPWVGGGFGAK